MIILNNKQNCSGCFACENICPKNCLAMISDIEGFWYPQVNKKLCNECRLCEIVCPILTKVNIHNELIAYSCINKDENVRLNSSSGGVFSILAENVINDGGVVFGAEFDEKFNVVHGFTDTTEGLSRFRGSKYVQSRIGDTYKKVREFLKQGRQVLFTGTPCQVGGLKSYLQQPYSNLFCIDIICHGVPSPKVWQKYKSYQEKSVGATIQRINFRHKDEGWKGFSVSFRFNNDSEYVRCFYTDIYMQAFLQNTCLRPSCYACNFKTLNRLSDITLADFWGIQNILPEMDDDKGTSLVIVHGLRGRNMFDEIKDKIFYKEVDINKAVKYNQSAINSVKQSPKREKFFEKVDKLTFDKLVKKYCSETLIMRTKRIVKAIGYIVLRSMGLLNLARKVKNLVQAQGYPS